MNFNIYKINFYSTILSDYRSIIVAIPKVLNMSEIKNTYLVFDGNDLMGNDDNNILNNNCNKNIYIGISSPNNVIRFNDLLTYKNYEVKPLMTKYFPDLATTKNNFLGGAGLKFCDFLLNELLPYLSNKFEFSIKNLNLLGCSLGAYFSLQMLYISKIEIKKIIILSPSIWVNKQIIIDLKTKILNQNKPLNIILWVGKKEPHFFEKVIPVDYYNDALKLKAILTANKNISLDFFLDQDGGHGYKWWINFLNSNLNLLN